MANPQRLSIIVPVYNEERPLADLVERVRSVPLDTEIIAVDAGIAAATGDLIVIQDADSGIRRR